MLSHGSPAAARVFCESLHDPACKSFNVIQLVFAKRAEIFFRTRLCFAGARHFHRFAVFTTRGGPILQEVRESAPWRAGPDPQGRFRQSLTLDVLLGWRVPVFRE